MTTRPYGRERNNSLANYNSSVSSSLIDTNRSRESVRDDSSAITNSNLDNESTEDDYKMNREAVHYAVAWEFEMWRRTEEARFQAMLEKKMTLKMKELDEEYIKKHKVLADKFEAKKDELLSLQNQVKRTLEGCDKEKKKLDNEKKLLEKTREKLKKEYENKVRDCDMLVNAARNECAQREAATEARARSLKNEVEFWKEQLKNAQEALRQKDEEMKEQIKSAMSTPESVLRAQLIQRESDLAQTKINLQQKTDELEKRRSQLDQALRLLEDTREKARKYKNAAEAAEAALSAKDQVESELRKLKDGKKKWKEVGYEIQQVKQMIPTLRGAVSGTKERLIKERHDLLTDGLYSENDEVIQELDRQIAMCYD